MLQVHRLPVLSDNYVFLLRDEASGQTAVVDPAVAPAVQAELARLGWKLDYILNTHHHSDHVGGNLELRRATGCRVVGARADRGRIPGLDVEVGDGDIFYLGKSRAEVWDLSGHTLGHIGFYFGEGKAGTGAGDFFVGDTVFGFGCGRLFEGSPEQMWAALARIRALPGDTRLWCAHEYTEANSRFALEVAPGDKAVAARARSVREAHAAARPTVPLRLGEELATNPFLCERILRAQAPAAFADLNQALLEGFRKLRHDKDSF